jgi:hypothetical protein
MQRRKLEIESIQVESFEVGEAMLRVGTVRAHGDAIVPVKDTEGLGDWRTCTCPAGCTVISYCTCFFSCDTGCPQVCPPPPPPPTPPIPGEWIELKLPIDV